MGLAIGSHLCHLHKDDGYLKNHIYIYITVKKTRKKNTIKYTADRTFYMTVFPMDKDREMKIVSLKGLSCNFGKL